MREKLLPRPKASALSSTASSLQRNDIRAERHVLRKLLFTCNRKPCKMHETEETPPEPAQKMLTPQEEYKIDVIKSHLSRLSVLEIDIVNARDFSHASPAGQEVLSHISSHFRAKHDNVPALMNFEEFMEQWRGMYAQMPEIRLEVTNVWCHVDDDKQHATVHLDTVLKGSAPDLAVGAMGELQWKVRKTDGRWMLMKYVGLRGPAY